MIKAIFFDIGGVLMDLDIDRCIESFRSNCGMERITEFLDPCHQKGPIKALESGETDEAEFYSQMKAYCRPGTTDKQIADSFCSLLSSISTEKVSLVKSLKGKYDLFLLSNNNPITMRYTASVFAELGIAFEDYFKDVYISCWMKSLKPYPEIFQECVKRCGFKPEEILFIDDSRTNIDGGKAVGLQTLYYDTQTSLTQAVDFFLSKEKKISW